MIAKDIKEIILYSMLLILCIYSLFVVTFGQQYGFSEETIQNFNAYLKEILAAALLLSGVSNG